MMSISSYNPEYNAKPWLNTMSNPPLPTAGGQGVPITTLAIPENGGGTVTTPALGENGSGLPPIDYSLPKDFTGFGENGNSLPPVTTLAFPANGDVGLPIISAPGENGSGTPPRYHKIGKRFVIDQYGCQQKSLPNERLVGNEFVETKGLKWWMFKSLFATNPASRASAVNPYPMVQNPWMRSSSSSTTNTNFFWSV
jgi:hypothetical protein